MKRKISKKKKEVIGFSTNDFLLFIALGLFVFLNINYFYDIGSEFKYNFYANKDLNDSFVNKVVDRCYDKYTEKQKINCVWSYVSDNFEYELRDNYWVKSPEEVVNSNGMCIDALRIYKSIFKQLHIKTRVVSLPNHIFLIAYTNGRGYAVLDIQRIMWV